MRTQQNSNRIGYTFDQSESLPAFVSLFQLAPRPHFLPIIISLQSIRAAASYA